MTIHVDGPVTVYQGDVREALSQLPAESVQCCVTSPPYWGLRDYGTATWDGGEVGCDHRESGTNRGGRSDLPNPPAGWAERAIGKPYGALCGKCGAVRVDTQLGLEATPDEYVCAMVEVFREVRRVLRKDGTLWLNLGDSYAGSWGAQSRGGGPSEASTLRGNGHVGGGPKVRSLSAVQIAAHPKRERTGSIPAGSGLKPKDLVGIPWRVAFALQADGWYLRSDIIWSKPNPMPESVTDRPTKAHEYLFLMTRSPRYYYDADAIREANLHPDRSGSNPRLAVSTQPGNTFQSRPDHVAIDSNPAGRNKRTVWEIATQPYPDAHFATFPEDLVVPCIKAGSREGDAVLDPFAGSGTTLAVARRLSRKAIGIELQATYLPLIGKRVSEAALPLLEAI